MSPRPDVVALGSGFIGLRSTTSGRSRPGERANRSRAAARVGAAGALEPTRENRPSGLGERPLRPFLTTLARQVEDESPAVGSVGELVGRRRRDRPFALDDDLITCPLESQTNEIVSAWPDMFCTAKPFGSSTVGATARAPGRTSHVSRQLSPTDLTRCGRAAARRPRADRYSSMKPGPRRTRHSVRRESFISNRRKSMVTSSQGINRSRCEKTPPSSTSTSS